MPPDTDQSAGEAGTAAGTANHGCPESDGRGALHRVWEYLTAVRDSRVKEQEQIVKLQKMWALRKPILDAHILALQGKVQGLEQEIDQITMEQIKIGRHGSLGQRNPSSV